MSTHKEADLPRVSTILRILEDSYSGVPQASLDKAAERGQRLHRLCLTYLASLDGVHVAPEVEPEDKPAYQAFVKWCNDNAVLVVAIEERSESIMHRYVGTPDALIFLHGQENLIDLKFTAAIMRVNKVQIQAYRHLDLYRTAKQALLIHINPVTGDLKIHNIKKNPSDWAAFLNALSVWKWRQS